MQPTKPNPQSVLLQLEDKKINDTFILPKGERLFWLLLVYVGGTFIMLPLMQWWIADPTAWRSALTILLFLLWCWFMKVAFFPSGFARSPGSREYLTFEGNNLLTYLSKEPRKFSRTAWSTPCQIVVLEYRVKKRFFLRANIHVVYESFQQKQQFGFYVDDLQELLTLENQPNRVVAAIPKILGGPVLLKKDLSNINVTLAEKEAIFQAIQRSTNGK